MLGREKKGLKEGDFVFAKQPDGKYNKIIYGSVTGGDGQKIGVNGIIIEDVNYKPKTDSILNVIRRYRGDIVLTSINEKDVPKEINAKCQIKRACSHNYLTDSIKELAPHSQEPFALDKDTYSLVMFYLKETDRDMF